MPLRSIVALLQGCAAEPVWLCAIATVSRWKSRSSFTSGLLARSTEAHPLNAPSPSMPVRPLIITTLPLSRTSAFAEAASGTGRVHRASIRSGCSGVRSGRRSVALISNFSGLPPLRALPDTLILRSPSTVTSALTVSILFSTRSRKLENTTVPPMMLTCSTEKESPVPAAAGLGAGLVVLHALALQRHVHDRTDDDEFGDLRAAGPHARQRHVGLDAAGGQAIADVAVLRILQRDVVQGDVERRPEADFGAAIDGELVAGFALDPFLDLRRQEAGGNADHQQQRDHGGHGSDGVAAIFNALISTFQTGRRASFRSRRARLPADELIPERDRAQRSQK